jgi:hypothetical protein
MVTPVLTTVQEYEFDGGFPTPDTIQRAYDEADLKGRRRQEQPERETVGRHHPHRVIPPPPPLLLPIAKG